MVIYLHVTPTLDVHPYDLTSAPALRGSRWVQIGKWRTWNHKLM